MKTFIAIIIVWAILFGFLATGVKVLATTPHAANQVQTDAPQQMNQRINPGQSNSADDVVMSENEARNRVRDAH